MHDATVEQRTKRASFTWSDGSGDADPYVFVGVIARGGMGYVELCCCRDAGRVRWVARKRLQAHFRGDRQFRAMFMDEARLARLVQHPNVVGVSAVGEDAEGPFLIMDYVEGISLSRLVRRMARARCSVPMQVAVWICRDVALGLHAAHEARAENGALLNLVHRDVSPQNVLIGFDGSVRVTDFGIAKALGNESQTTAGVLKGNMGYLSPEQLRFEEPDRRSDLFSLGVTLFELLSGTRLYANRAGFEGTRRILTEPPLDIRGLRPDAPPALAQLLLQMLSKRIAGRPATALEVAARLEAVRVDLMMIEEPISVADYVDQHLAGERERHATIVAEHLRRAEGRLPAATRPAARQKIARPWLVALVVAALAASAAAVARSGFGLALSPPIAADPVTRLPSPPIEIVPLPPAQTKKGAHARRP
jgi:serine/threonine-protein kinase